ncbi:MAG: hypothetical protein ACRCW6_01730 [Mycoplasmoidaceae bacterium]
MDIKINKKKNNLGFEGTYRFFYNQNYQLTSKTKVLVFHDGQAIFTTVPIEKSSDWHFEELVEKKNLDVFVIAIDSKFGFFERISLLTPFPIISNKFDNIVKYEKLKSEHKPIGKEYLDLVKEIVDELLDLYNLKNNQISMIGASMGGYITLYASSLEQFHNYTNFIALSPAVFCNENKLYDAIKDIKNKNYLISYGTNEEPKGSERDYIHYGQEIIKILEINNNVSTSIVENGKHDRDNWMNVIENNLKFFGLI